MRFSRSFVLLSMLAAATLSAAPDAPPPVVELGPKSVRVSSATAGGRVVLFGIARRATSGDFAAQNFAGVRKADEHGVVVFNLPVEIDTAAVFAVIDYETGRYSVAGPTGSAHFAALPHDFFKRRDGEYDRLDVDTHWVEAICVRPKKGAWRMFLLDGAGADRDGKNDGRTMFDAESMTRLAGEDASPKKFRRGDVVILIDPRHLLVRGTEVPE